MQWLLIRKFIELTYVAQTFSRVISDGLPKHWEDPTNVMLFMATLIGVDIFNEIVVKVRSLFDQ